MDKKRGLIRRRSEKAVSLFDDFSFEPKKKRKLPPGPAAKCNADLFDVNGEESPREKPDAGRRRMLTVSKLSALRHRQMSHRFGPGAFTPRAPVPLSAPDEENFSAAPHSEIGSKAMLDVGRWATVSQSDKSEQSSEESPTGKSVKELLKGVAAGHHEDAVRLAKVLRNPTDRNIVMEPGMVPRIWGARLGSSSQGHRADLPQRDHSAVLCVLRACALMTFAEAEEMDPIPSEMISELLEDCKVLQTAARMPGLSPRVEARRSPSVRDLSWLVRALRRECTPPLSGSLLGALSEALDPSCLPKAATGAQSGRTSPLSKGKTRTHPTAERIAAALLGLHFLVACTQRPYCLVLGRGNSSKSFKLKPFHQAIRESGLLDALLLTLRSLEARVHDVASRGDASRGDVLVPALEGVSMILTVIEDACAGPSVMDQPCEEQQGREAFGGGAVDLRAADAGAQNREDDPDSEGFQRQYKALRVSQAKENQSHMVAWVGDQVPRECAPVAGSGRSESSSRRRNLIAVLADFVRGCMRAICHGEDAQGAQRASWEAVGQCLAVLINLTHLNKAAGTCLTDCNGGIPTLVHLFLLLRKTRVDSSAQRFSKALGSEEAWDLEILVLSVLLNVLEYSEPARASVLRITIFEDAPSDAFREGNRPRDHPVYAQFATSLIHFLTSDSETFKSEMESADMNGASSADDVLAAVGDLNGDGVHETKGQHWQRDLIVCAYYSLLLGTFFSAGAEQLEVRKTIREHLPEKSTWFPRRILKAFLAMQYHQGVVVEDIFAPVLMTIHNMEKSDAELGEAQRSDETLSADEGIHRVPMAKEAAAPCSPSASGETCHPSPSSRDLMDLSQESSSDEVDLGTRRMRSYGKGPREARRRAPVRREIKSDEETSARIGQGAEPSEDSTEGVREKGNTLAHQAVGKIRNGGAPASHGFEATVHSENHGKQPGESVAPSRRAEDAFPSPRKPARNLLKASTTKAKHIGTGVGLHRRTSAQARAMPKGKAAQAEAHGPTAAKATIIRRRLPVARLKNGAKSDATPSKVFDFDL